MVKELKLLILPVWGSPAYRRQFPKIQKFTRLFILLLMVSRFRFEV